MGCKEKAGHTNQNPSPDWIVGKWKRLNDKAGSSTYEEWWKDKNGLSGYGFRITDKDTVFKEHLKIEDIDGALSYVVRGVNPEPTYFKFTDTGTTSFSSHNPKNDFPKTITYEIRGDSLLASISDGETEIPFLFVKFNDPQKSCIDFIIEKDEYLGSKRNHDCETNSLSYAVNAYIDGLEELNYDNCPSGFKSSFSSHISAWKEIIPVLDQYDSLRGEMHDLFDEIKRGKDSSTLNQKEALIWSTWEEVERYLTDN